MSACGGFIGLIIGVIAGVIEACIVIYLGWVLFAILGACNVSFDESMVRHIIHIVGYVIIGLNTVIYTAIGFVDDE